MARWKPKKRSSVSQFRRTVGQIARRQNEQVGRLSVAGLTVLGGATGIFAGALILAYNTPHAGQAVNTAAAYDQSFFAGPLSIGQPVPALNNPSLENEQADRDKILANTTITFEFCGKVRRTCVVDGDTFWLNGKKVRIADIDTPEIGSPQCESEHQLGLRAKRRLLLLLNEGPFELQLDAEGRDVDAFGRQLRIVVRNGRSIGDQLVQEGLAHRWEGGKQSWCG